VKPYYQHAGITIYHGDCREILPHLDPVDLVLADPPYNSGIVYGAMTHDRRPDYWEWLSERIQLFKADCVLIKHSSLKIADFQSRFPSRILVWIKPFSSGFPLNGVATHWEPIHWLRGDSKAWSKDYFECSGGAGNSEPWLKHPAQMPEALARWLLSTFTKTKGTVLDPFMGSGTTLRAAKDLGRRAIGIEIEERYCEIAARRLAQELLPFAEV